MNKKLIAVMLIATLLFVGVFAACNNNGGNSGNNEDEYTYTPPKLYLEDDAYHFYTDENGERMLNEFGEFIVFETDENGKFKIDEDGDRMTVVEPFQAYSKGNMVEDYGYRITVPENWVAAEDRVGGFRNTVTNDTVTITVYDKSYQDAYESNFKTYEDLKATEGLTVTWEENVQDLGAECEGVIRFTLKLENKMNVLYIFRNHGNIYKILYESNNATAAVSDSVAICKAISYKPFDYFEPVTDENGKEVTDVFLTQPHSTEAASE